MDAIFNLMDEALIPPSIASFLKVPPPSFACHGQLEMLRIGHRVKRGSTSSRARLLIRPCCTGHAGWPVPMRSCRLLLDLKTSSLSPNTSQHQQHHLYHTPLHSPLHHPTPITMFASKRIATAATGMTSRRFMSTQGMHTQTRRARPSYKRAPKTTHWHPKSIILTPIAISRRPLPPPELPHPADPPAGRPQWPPHERRPQQHGRQHGPQRHAEARRRRRDHHRRHRRRGQDAGRRPRHHRPRWRRYGYRYRLRRPHPGCRPQPVSPR